MIDPKAPTDRNLVAAHQAATGEPGDETADALAAELKARGLGF